jgi:large subunit ribosomal protein L3
VIAMASRKKHAPRHGSLAYLPRKRAAQIKGRIRNWPDIDGDIGFLGFAGFKAGMTHITYIEDQEDSPYYGKELMKAVTIIEVPPLLLVGVKVYKKDEYGKYIIGELYSPNQNENLSRKINPPNPENYDFEEEKDRLMEKIDESCEIRGVFQTQPYRVSLPRKKPDIMEIKVN